MLQKVDVWLINCRWDFLGKNPQTFMIPIYNTTVLYDRTCFFFVPEIVKKAFVAIS